MKPYIFIHINKCGGTSVKRVLNGRTRYQKYKHEPIADIAQRMSKQEFDNHFKFAFIRNPYDRIKSMYLYRKFNLRRVKLKDMGFKEWFYKAFTTDFTAVPLMNKPCWHYISIDDELAVDFIGKLENVKQDWDKVCAHLGIKAALPRVNRSIQKELSFDEGMKRIVENQFQKDLELY